jgi:hypothetical protein
VAATLDELLRSGRPSRVILYVNGGQDPIAQALEGQVRPRPQGVM